MDKEYRHTLTEAVNFLSDTTDTLFSKAINVLMYGELKDVNEAFDIGEPYDFKIEHLETANDNNVELLTKLIKQIDHVKETIININNISDDEL